MIDECRQTLPSVPLTPPPTTILMAVTVDIPESLIDELRAWYEPRDKFVPVGDKKPLNLGPCHGSKTCADAFDSDADQPP